jgi:hypothetical protein
LCGSQIAVAIFTIAAQDEQDDEPDDEQDMQDMDDAVNEIIVCHTLSSLYWMKR